MTFELIHRDSCLVVCISGDIDHHSAAQIRTATDPEIERVMPSMLIFDLGEVSFMDSSGIGLILGRQRLMESLGGAVAIKNPPPAVRKIITLSGLSRLILNGDKTERTGK